MADLARRLPGTSCQHAHFRGHHGKAPSLLASACGFHRSIEREDVGLKSNAINHADDFVHAPRTLLNRFDRFHRARHGLRALLCCLADLAGTRIGPFGRLGVAMHGARELLYAGGGLLQARRLLLGAIGERPVATGQHFTGMRYQCRVAAHVGHHGRQSQHHPVKQPPKHRHLAATAQGGACSQVTSRGLLHSARQRRYIAIEPDRNGCDQIDHEQHTDPKHRPQQPIGRAGSSQCSDSQQCCNRDGGHNRHLQ